MVLLSFTQVLDQHFSCAKPYDFTKGWRITDSKRAATNRIFASLFPELTFAEYTATGTSEQGQDFVSNGVKLRSTNTRDNRSGHTITFLWHLRNHHLKIVGQGKIKLWHLN